MGSISTADELVDILTIDAQGLKALLDRGVISTQNLVKQYLAQIQRHEHKLHAMIQTTPENLLVARAALLDQERAAGKTRGPLHGIPIVIKASPSSTAMKQFENLTTPGQHCYASESGTSLKCWQSLAAQLQAATQRQNNRPSLIPSTKC